VPQFAATVAAYDARSCTAALHAATSATSKRASEAPAVLFRAPVVG